MSSIIAAPVLPSQRAAYSYPVACEPEVDALLAENAVVAIGISGGKDSSAVAIRLVAYLDEIGHRGPRVLIHSDLGRIEWRDSLPVCEKLAQRLGMELMVVRRAAGDMQARWEKRWQNNVARYADLSCVTLILPWSTPAMRFCTSELKTAVICSALNKRFPTQPILSVTGIRRAESASRAKMPVLQPQPKLTKKNRVGYNWNPIIDWPTEAVYDYLAQQQDELHEAYRVYGSSRVSCTFCVMGAGADLRAAAGCADNHDVYRDLVDLELVSGFGFQGSRWLADVAPELLRPDARERVSSVKAAAKIRMAAEARIPKHLKFTAGKATALPTWEEAELLAQVRQEVAAAVGISVRFTDPASIIVRYNELMEGAEEAEEVIDENDAMNDMGCPASMATASIAVG